MRDIVIKQRKVIFSISKWRQNSTQHLVYSSFVHSAPSKQDITHFFWIPSVLSKYETQLRSSPTPVVKIWWLLCRRCFPTGLPQFKTKMKMGKRIIIGWSPTVGIILREKSSVRHCCWSPFNFYQIVARPVNPSIPAQCTLSLLSETRVLSGPGDLGDDDRLAIKRAKRKVKEDLSAAKHSLMPSLRQLCPARLILVTSDTIALLPAAHGIVKRRHYTDPSFACFDWINR